MRGGDNTYCWWEKGKDERERESERAGQVSEIKAAKKPRNAETITVRRRGGITKNPKTVKTGCKMNCDAVCEPLLNTSVFDNVMTD